MVHVLNLVVPLFPSTPPFNNFLDEARRSMAGIGSGSHSPGLPGGVFFFFTGFGLSQVHVHSHPHPQSGGGPGLIVSV